VGVLEETERNGRERRTLKSHAVRDIIFEVNQLHLFFKI
jgi:hypothetical protein